MGTERGPALSINEWARKQRGLLKLERDEEKSQVSDTIAQLSPQDCVERGVSLLPLAVAGLSTGLYGRACVSVGDPKGRVLPAHRLGAGDEVRLYSTKGSKGGKGADAEEGVSEISGIVGKVTETTVEVISEDADEAGSLRPPLRLDVVASEATHKKLMLGLDALEKYPGGGPAERVISVLFGLTPPSALAVGGAPTPPSPATASRAAAVGGGGASSAAVSSALGSLNDSQREAVAFALATRDVALIHGPPGTGKTTTVVALVREAVARGWRCLVCAPSNVAVDGILERLVAAEAGSGSRSGSGGSGSGSGGGGRKNGDRLRVARMGHPARLLPQVLEHSMEALVSRHEGTAIVKDVRTEIDKLLLQLYGEPGAGAGEGAGKGGGSGKPRPRIRGADRKGARQEVKALRKEARARESKVVQEVLRSRDVVLATCVGAATHSLRDQEFDLVVIDEAAQALEAACWIPILKGRRLVLAGDHKQLAPTVKSREAEAGTLTNAEAARDGGGGGGGGGSGDGLGLTMFDRVLRDLGHQVCRMLDVQYRMNRDICDWASTEMYGGLLRADPSCAERELPDLPHTHTNAGAGAGVDMWSAVMLLVDTTGCDMPEEEAGGGSRRNEREAEVAVRHVKGLLEAGVSESEVAVISPYNGQVNLLKRLLRPEHPRVEVRSVDGFQGGEKEAIVLSLVRSNPGKTVGFLADARRLNVAVTRAKRHVAVICDAECCGSDAFIRRLLTHIEDRGEYRSALELDMQSDGGDLEVPMAAFGGGGTVDVAAAVARGHGSGSATEGSRDRRTKRKSEATEEKISDEGVLKRVHEFDQREMREGEAGLEEEELPSELTARQRALVHETAERLGLGHYSRGEGPRRAVVLSKVKVTVKVKVKGGGGFAGAVVEEGGGGGGGESPRLVIGHSSSSSSNSSSSSSSSCSSEAPGAVGDSLFSVLTGKEGSEEDKDDDDDVDDGDTSGTKQEVEAPTTASAGRGTRGPNTLLADLHAERASRRPAAPPPPPPKAGRKMGGKKKTAAAGGGGAGPDDRGFTVDIPHGGGSGSGAKKSAPKKGASSSKKGKKKTGGGARGGVAGARAVSSRGSAKASDGKGRHDGDGDGGEDDDDDLLFLDSQIKKERASEPCYASLLRSTTEVMRANNPRWAAAEDRGKPSKSVITGARRTQLKGALETKKTEKEKNRTKITGDKGKKP